jgi:hypothetical protein
MRASVEFTRSNTAGIRKLFLIKSDKNCSKFFEGHRRTELQNPVPNEDTVALHVELVFSMTGVLVWKQVTSKRTAFIPTLMSAGVKK